MAVQDYKGLDWNRPIRDAVAVSASAEPLAQGACRAIYLGTAGDLTVTFEDGSSVEFNNLAAGIWHPMSVTHITVIDNSAANVRVGY
jgi:hypothetical protein